MVSKRLTIWFRKEQNQERIRLWMGAVGAAILAVMTVPLPAEAQTVRIIKGDGAQVLSVAPEGIKIVNRRAAFIIVDVSEIGTSDGDASLAGAPSRRALRSNHMRIDSGSVSDVQIYKGGRLVSN
ncbi:MAG: hypothetical protein AAF950_07700 [Pseudomonadota bacterium]